MNKLYFLCLISSLLIIVSILSLTSDSFAQSKFPFVPIPPKYGVITFVQTFLYNSEGQLVAYLASDKFSDFNLGALNVLLDSEATESDPIITINDNKFQVIQRQLTIPYDKDNVIASTILADNNNDSLTMVLRFAHDGYPIRDGDKVVSVWTFIIPVQE